MSDSGSRPAENGFTLLEVLVAFVIAGLALAVLTGTALNGLASATLSSRYQEALARAQSHLAAIGPAPEPSDRQGEEADGFHWHVRIVRLASGPVAGAGPGGGLGRGHAQVALYDATVAISWGAAPGRTVQLRSERIGITPPASAP